jgi:Domain of unknown function (DUF1926)
VDHDYDGALEACVHSAHFTAVVSSARGGAIEELTLLGSGVNLADTLTRRREPYHVLADDAHAATPAEPSGEHASGEHASGEHAPSIHEIEQGLRLRELPPVDLDVRALFVDRVLAADVTDDAFERAAYVPLRSWAGTPLAMRVEPGPEAIVVVLTAEDGSLEKRIRFEPSGAVEVSWAWTPEAYPAGSLFTTELSIFGSARLRGIDAVGTWTFPIATVGKSERGLERTEQGFSTTMRWNVEAGAARAQLWPVLDGAAPLPNERTP